MQSKLSPPWIGEGVTGALKEELGSGGRGEQRPKHIQGSETLQKNGVRGQGQGCLEASCPFQLALTEVKILSSHRE